jgi:hypothetical protein
LQAKKTKSQAEKIAELEKKGQELHKRLDELEAKPKLTGKQLVEEAEADMTSNCIVLAEKRPIRYIS